MNYIDLFITARRAEGLSDETLRTYRQTLTRFSHWVKGDLLSVSPSEIRIFLVHLRENRLSSYTVHKYYRSLSAFYNFLVYEAILEISPTWRVRQPRIEHRLIRPFTPQQIEALFGATRFTRQPERNRLIFAVFLDTGIRLSELTGLHVADLDFSQRSLYVFGKGSKERRVPFGQRLARRLEIQAGLRNDGDYLFTKLNTNNPVRPVSLTRLVNRCGRLVGINNTRCSPHTFRHTFAYRCLKQGMDLETLRRIMGHSTIEVTRKYLALLTEDLCDSHTRFGPIDNLPDLEI